LAAPTGTAAPAPHRHRCGAGCFNQHRRIVGERPIPTSESQGVSMRLQVARIGKPHGIRGEVTVQLMTDDPDARFEPGTVFDVEAGPVQALTVEGARWNKEILLVAFEEIVDRNAAETVRGARLFIETEDLDEDDDDTWYEHELVGLNARIGDEVVGKVTGLRTNAAQ